MLYSTGFGCQRIAWSRARALQALTTATQEGTTACFELVLRSSLVGSFMWGVGFSLSWAFAFAVEGLASLVPKTTED